MARKRPTAVVPRITVQSVEAELKKTEYSKALSLAARLVESEPSDSHLACYTRTLTLCVDGYLRQGKVKSATETIRLAELFAQSHASQRPAVAATLARCGEFDKALGLADVPATRMHIADLCMRRNRADGAPTELKADFAIVQAAFRDYEAGRDDMVRDALGKLGLTSSFLSWKLLLRGLQAYAVNDISRAIENWQRLPADGLAAQLAAPLRCRIDPDFRRSLPANRATEFDRATENVFSGGLAGELREIQTHTGRDQDLTPIWKPVASLLPKLRAVQPSCVPRLASALYHLIVRQGRPADLESYRRQFPSPHDDPKFDRLRALACEATGEDDFAVEYWIAYEQWLATTPAGWPPDLLARARAIVLQRIGRLIEDLNIADQAPAELRRAMAKMLGEPLEPSNFGNPDDYYRKSLVLAPDRSEAACLLFDRMMRSQRWAAAERVATDFLAQQPDELDLLERLMDALREQGRSVERLAIAKRAAAVNPMDAEIEHELIQAYLATARWYLFQGDTDSCERILVEAGPMREARNPAAFGSLRAILARCRKQPAEAEVLESQLLERPGLGPAAALYLSVLGQLARLKPAQRKPAEQRLRNTLANAQPTASEALGLLTAIAEMDFERMDFRGRATLDKKILAMVERSVNSDANESEFEFVLRTLMNRKNHKTVSTMAARLATRFPKSPVFPLFELQASVLKSPGRRPTGTMLGKLSLARRLAEACDRPDRSEILDAIKKIQAALDPFGGRFLFGGPFGRDPYDGDDD
ncbi:MAG: hypothetical protein JNK93_16270 [Planctomycetia bacterium]|nr:hypothetical protein [Planctomycetia bacterium]